MTESGRSPVPHPQRQKSPTPRIKGLPVTAALPQNTGLLFLTVNNLLLKKRCEIKELGSMYLIVAPTLNFGQ